MKKNEQNSFGLRTSFSHIDKLVFALVGVMYFDSMTFKMQMLCALSISLSCLKFKRTLRLIHDSKMMRLILIIPLFLVFSCKSEDNDFPCIRFEESVGHLELYCANFTGTVPETCSKIDSKEVAERFSSDTQQIKRLKYSGCNKVTIPNITNLFEIDISQSKYESLSSIKLNHQFLANFNASHNSITTVPLDFFKSAPNLTEVDLSYNRITRIDACTFEHSKNLEFIDLSNNNIELHDGLIFHAAKPKVIHMENNPLVDLNCRWFSLAKGGATVHMTWKNIRNIDNECFNEADIVLNENESLSPAPHRKITLQCNEMSFGRLWGSHRIEFVQCFSTNITRLDLYGSLWGKVNQNTFKRFTELNELDLSDTRLQHFDFVWLENNQKLHTLNLESNHLKSLYNVEILQTLKNLVELDMTGNQVRNTREVIHYLSPTIRRLNLRWNSIGRLDANAFEKLEQLEELDLRSTNLSFVDRSPFEPLQNLQTLMISDNNFEHTDFPTSSKVLTKLLYFYAGNCRIRNATKLTKFLPPSLWRLDLSGNYLGEIDANTFETTPHLLQLYLENSNLTMTKWNAFDQLQELMVLDISDNSLEHVHFPTSSPPLNRLMRLYARNCSIKNLPGLLSVLPSIKHLDLSDNILNEVNADTFSEAQYLGFLRLRNTNLSKFDFNTINENAWYLDLDLSFNHLKRVDLSPLKYVEDLNLEGNYLMEIDTLRAPMEIDMKIMISNNQFSCEYLTSFVEKVRHFERLRIVGDPWKQKHHKNCKRNIDLNLTIDQIIKTSNNDESIKNFSF